MKFNTCSGSLHMNININHMCALCFTLDNGIISYFSREHALARQKTVSPASASAVSQATERTVLFHFILLKPMEWNNNREKAFSLNSIYRDLNFGFVVAVRSAYFVLVVLKLGQDILIKSEWFLMDDKKRLNFHLSPEKTLSTFDK